VRFLVFARETPTGPPGSPRVLDARIAALARALKTHGHAVETSTARTDAERTRALRSANADVVLCGPEAAAQLDASLTRTLVVDLTGAAFDRPDAEASVGSAAVREALEAVARGDTFLVSSARERLYFLSFLLRNRVEQPETHIVAVPGPEEIGLLVERLQEGTRATRREVDVDFAFPEQASLPVMGGRPVEQDFLSRVDGLCRVACCLSRRGRERVAPVTLSLFRLGGDAPAPRAPRERLAEVRLEDASIRDNDWVALDFEPVTDSAGVTFTLRVDSSAESEDEAVWPWAFGARLFPLLGLRHGERPLTRRSLCFRTTSARRSS
jgi:hypothetical protein